MKMTVNSCGGRAREGIDDHRSLASMKMILGFHSGTENSKRDQGSTEETALEMDLHLPNVTAPT